MITLHSFGPLWNIPDPSPFVTKAEVLLKMSGVPFTTTLGNLSRAPKGKLPYIEDDGAVIADSTFIRLHLERKYGTDFDKHLSSAEKGVAWAVEKMLEDNLYWVVVYERWMVDANFRIGPRSFFNAAPAPLRPLIATMVRRLVRKNLHAHGLGRHSRDEIVLLGKRAIDALAGVLGDKPYLMGAHKCGADATAFAFVVGLLCPLFETQLLAHTQSHKNLVAYCDRMSREFFAEQSLNQRAAV
jgi:glutathione S-transferase